MIFLTSEIIVQVRDSENYKLSADKWYKVIGTGQRDTKKDGRIEKADVFIVVNNEGRIVTLFPSKCEIRILSEKKS